MIFRVAGTIAIPYCFVCLSLLSSALNAADDVQSFFATYCVDCHSGADPAAEIDLDQNESVDWSASSNSQTYERVLEAIRNLEMPPSDAEQPEPEHREWAVSALHQQLLQHSSVGGTVLRRLTRIEYENSIRQIFGIDFSLPESFPANLASHNFENRADTLVMSAPLMDAYFHSAISVADQLIPPASKAVEPGRFRILPQDMVISYSSGARVDGTMRLAARTDQLWRSSTWPAKFEARSAGRYRIKVVASKFAPGSAAWPGPVESVQMRVLARSLHEKDGEAVSKQRVLGDFTISESTPTEFEMYVPLYPGETPVVYMPDGILDGDRTDRAELETTLREMFTNDPRLLAGWLSVEHSNGLRGGLGWDRVKAIRDSAALDLDSVDMSSKAVDKLVKKMSSNPGLYVETVIFQLFEEGPALSIHSMDIEGPLEPVEDPVERANRELAGKFFGGTPDQWTRSDLESFLDRFLSSVFRRPATADELAAYLALIEGEQRAGQSTQAALHLAIRSALMSPNFLYRGHRPDLDQYDLAARLSFFLTNGPPDAQLLSAASRGELKDSDSLRAHAMRLLSSDKSQSFVSEFTSSWLGTKHLSDIMPDTRLFPTFSDQHREAMVLEAEMFFAEILHKNLALQTFIQPDFTFADKLLAKDIYGMDNVKHNEIRRIKLPTDSPYGGLLGQAGIMMATANGVDTQPVERGVWVLRNILGTPPPPPPENVPALTPDTRSAQSVREMLLAHQSKSSCAACHKRIDPLGFVLENFDPIGRWRTHYPANPSDQKDAELNTADRIESTVTLPNGTQLEDVRDLREFVVNNIDSFARCIAEKLLTYATGRQLSYAERDEVRLIVSAHQETDAGFQDLLMRLIQSRTFRTK